MYVEFSYTLNVEISNVIITSVYVELSYSRLLQSLFIVLCQILRFSLYTKVQHWLGKLFDGASVPEYSSTDGRVLDALYDMAQRSEERSRQLAILTRDMDQKIAEYDSESMFSVNTCYVIFA